MKKYRFLVLLSMILLSFSFLLIACDPPEPPSDEIIIDKTSIETQYLVGETFDFSNIKVKAITGGVESNLAFNKLKLSSFSTATAGKFDLVVSYGELEDRVELTVHTPEAGVNFEVLSFEQPESLTAYNENIKEKSADNKRNEFMDREQGYFVGTENDYILKPKVTADKIIGTKPYVFTYEYESTITVEQLVDDDFETLTGSNLTQMVSYNAKKGTFKFTNAAIGKTFKLTIAVDPEEADADLVGSFSHTVTIVDGYNAHNLAEFSMLDNANEAWNDYKTANGLPLENNYKALLLHNNMMVTKADLPSAYFWNEGVGADGSLFDLTSVYKRVVAQDKPFDFIGNYFTVNVSTIPLVTRDNNDGEKLSNDNDVVIVSNVNLFHFFSSAEDRGEVSMKNLNIVGNAPRSNEKKYSGGLGMMHCDVARFEAYNNNAVKFITMYNAMNGSSVDNVMKITKTKSYDSFNSIVYIWNASYVYIEQSEMVGSGSPVIIISNPHGDIEGRPTPRLIIDGFAQTVSETASVIQTQVTGQETWFQINGAAPIASELGALSTKLQEMSGAISGGIAQIAQSMGQNLALPVRSFHKIEEGVTLFNPRVLIYPDNLNNTFYTKGEVYLGHENETHNAQEWQVVLAMDEMKTAPAQSPITALGGYTQQNIVDGGSPFVTSRGGQVPELLQLAGLPQSLPAEGFAVFSNSDFVLKDRLASSLASLENPMDVLNYLGLFLGDHLSIYSPIIHAPTDDGTPNPTSIGILLEYYSTPYEPA